jgi:hypothetical protein
MPLPALVPLAMKAAPVVASAISGLFGNRKQTTQQTNSYRRVTGMGRNARNQDFLNSLEARRSGEVAGFDNQLASLIMQQRNLAAQTGMQIAGANWGYDSSGTNTQPGNMIGGALNGGLSMLAAMSAMRQIMGGDGGGSGAGGGWDPNFDGMGDG